MTDAKILLYGTDWCGDCFRARRFLEKNNITYQWINIDKDKTAEQFVLKTNRGMRSVPTLVFSDGSILVEPSTVELANKLSTQKTSFR